MILKALAVIASTSFLALYLQKYEMAMVYPFDQTYVTPAEAGEARLAEQRFSTGDGERLVVWRAEAAPGRPTIVYFPGNAGGLKDRAERFRRLLDRGYGLVALAYRGSSGSSGKPDQALLIADALGVVAREAAPVVLYGESLGAAVAIQVAAAGHGDAVILEAPFTSVRDLVLKQFPMEDLTRFITQKWDSASVIGEITQPLMVVHGRNDRIVPFHMGRRIYEAAAATSKSLIALDGIGHSGTWTVEMQIALFDFMDDF